jgi:putative tryptophan/tyrosine transport system substrate-binding protein
MDRRAFVTVFGAVLAAPFAADAQHAGRLALIGFLETGSLFANSHLRKAFRERLRELGHMEGQSVRFEARGADGKIEGLADLAEELVRLKAEAIVTAGTEAAVAAKQATSTIPIVTAIVSDPVGLGLIASLARPGGNVTGVADLDVEQSGKRLELLKTVVPGLSRVALLWKRGHPKETESLREAEAAAKSLGLQLHLAGVRDANDLPRAFASMVAEQTGAFMVVADTMFSSNRAQILDFAAKSRLPAIFWRREFVDAGGLLSYGASYLDQYRRAAVFVDKILKGAKSADLPIEQPTTFELVINLKTAKALGLTIPPSLLLRADQVIE